MAGISDSLTVLKYYIKDKLVFIRYSLFRITMITRENISGTTLN